jgi:hypothetical protein
MVCGEFWLLGSLGCWKEFAGGSEKFFGTCTWCVPNPLFSTQSFCAISWSWNTASSQPCNSFCIRVAFVGSGILRARSPMSRNAFWMAKIVGSKCGRLGMIVCNVFWVSLIWFGLGIVGCRIGRFTGLTVLAGMQVRSKSGKVWSSSPLRFLWSCLSGLNRLAAGVCLVGIHLPGLPSPVGGSGGRGRSLGLGDSQVIIGVLSEKGSGGPVGRTQRDPQSWWYYWHLCIFWRFGHRGF